MLGHSIRLASSLDPQEIKDGKLAFNRLASMPIDLRISGSFKQAVRTHTYKPTSDHTCSPNLVRSPSTFRPVNDLHLAKLSFALKVVQPLSKFRSPFLLLVTALRKKTLVCSLQSLQDLLSLWRSTLYQSFGNSDPFWQCTNGLHMHFWCASNICECRLANRLGQNNEFVQCVYHSRRH
jgi:hypothetical protein